MTQPLLSYDLPEHLIAQEPAAPRDSSRLLVVNRSDSSLAHRIFSDLPELLAPGDLLILNDTRVVPARLRGVRAATGGKWEGLFLGVAPDGWELICQTRGRLRQGETILIEPGPLRLTLVCQRAGHWFAQPDQPGTSVELLERHGSVPLPPYIRAGQAVDRDRDRYQTVYAHEPGAVAAPTAGLHFTPELFRRLEERGVQKAFVTLHVGLGTFQPIKAEDVTQHVMHREWGRLSQETVDAMTRCKANGGRRIVAVGTTSVRVLETAAASGLLQAWEGDTNLFIYPPYRFRAVDALITNFHLPRSTLLLLVAAFAGVELTQEAYRVAVETSYRFFSYGDAMLIV